MTTDCGISRAGDPFVAAPRHGDAACCWHVLDSVLPALCRVRDGLETAGYEGLAERLEEVIGTVEVEHNQVERVVMAALGEE